MVQIGFSTTNSLLSRIIRWFTKSPTSHAFMITDVYGQPLVVDADLVGVRFITLEEFQRRNTIIKTVPSPLIQDGQLLRFLGTRYDFGGLIGMAFVVVGEWLKLKIKNPFHSSQAMFCSELIVEILQDAGHPGADKLDPSSTSPKALMDFLGK